MKIFRLAHRFATAFIIAMLTANAAFAAEARPWLCRDKPVFSSEHSMAYQVNARPGRQWKIFFMQFEPNAAHDGFDIVSTRDIPSRGETLKGNLPAGRYFAVALFLGTDRRWICPDYTHDNHNFKLGEVSNLCFAEDAPPCLVNLNVKPDQNLAQPLGASGP